MTTLSQSEKEAKAADKGNRRVPSPADVKQQNRWFRQRKKAETAKAFIAPC